MGYVRDTMSYSNYGKSRCANNRHEEIIYFKGQASTITEGLHHFMSGYVTLCTSFILWDTTIFSLYIAL